MNKIFFKTSLLILATTLLSGCVDDGVIYTDAPARVYTTDVAAAPVVPADGYYAPQTTPVAGYRASRTRYNNSYIAPQSDTANVTTTTPVAAGPVVAQGPSYTTSPTAAAPVVRRNNVVTTTTSSNTEVAAVSTMNSAQ